MTDLGEVKGRRRAVGLAVLAMALLLLPWAGGAGAQEGKRVKVSIEFRQSGIQSRDAVQGGGRVVITEKGSARSSGRLGADSRETRTQQSTGIFTIVRDGGEAAMTVATQVPYPQVTFYRDYATGAGYVATGVEFREVGTSLKVAASILSGNQVRVRLTPRISFFSPDRSGTIEFTEASTEVVVPSGRPLVVGGSTSQLHELTRQILGFRERQAGSETTIILTATIQ